MSMTQEPIIRRPARPVSYHGMPFRSGLEARWAIFFEHLGLTFAYEKQGFLLENIGGYLPDFWLEDRRATVPQTQGMWVEIKPTFPTKEEAEKGVVLCRTTRESVFIAVEDLRLSPQQIGALVLACREEACLAEAIHTADFLLLHSEMQEEPLFLKYYAGEIATLQRYAGRDPLIDTVLAKVAALRD